jgi:hypothetical protein
VAGISGLTLTVEYDDAYAVYLNGQRIAGNLPVDPAYNFYSGAAIEDTITAPITISPSLLNEGANLIAVEVHQSSGGSSDLSMNLSLTATRSTTPTPLFLTGGGERKLRVRALSGGTWSALTEASFLLDTDPASPANLAISEIHYHPADASPGEEAAGFDDSDFEFIELLNTGSRHVDLQGVYLYGAVNFDFTHAATGRTLAPGARVLVVSKREGFEMRYGSNKPVAGEYTGQLDNAGENVVLYTPGETVLRAVAYGDGTLWPADANGGGNSLVRRHPGDPAGDNDPDGWAVSGSVGGSPGTADVPAPGSFDAWTTAAFTPSQLGTAAVSGVSSDPDGDGRPNFEEFAFATDPLQTDEPLTEFAWVESGTGRLPGLRLRCPEVAGSILYELLASDEPGGEWTVVSEFPALTESLGGGFMRATFQDEGTSSGSQRFLRMRAVWTP